LLRSTFLNDLGSETLRSAFSGRRESLLRLFSATPPAIPAMAAPPATSGVFAFEASSATLLPAFETAPFCAVWRALVPADVRREADVPLRREAPDRPPVEPLRLELDRELPEEPFLLVDLFELERLRVDRLLEDRVVWAMIIASLGWLPCQLRLSPPAVHLDLPAVQGFELPLS
jgi:hypothetical protein